MNYPQNASWNIWTEIPFEKSGREWGVKINSFRIKGFCHTDKTITERNVPGFESRWAQDIFSSLIRANGTTHPPVRWEKGIFPQR